MKNGEILDIVLCDKVNYPKSLQYSELKKLFEKK